MESLAALARVLKLNFRKAVLSASIVAAVNVNNLVAAIYLAAIFKFSVEFHLEFSAESSFKFSLKIL